MTTAVSERSTPQWLLHWATTTPDAVAVVENNESFTYRELAHSVAQYVRLLQSIGIKKGMLVGIQCNYRYLHLLLVLACEVIGAPSISFNEDELASANKLLPRCTLLCIENPNDFTRQLNGVLVLNQDILNKAAGVPIGTLGVLDTTPSDHDVIRVFRSSGSTGRAKTIPITESIHRKRIATYIRYGYSESHRFSIIIVGPMSFSPGFHSVKSALTLGQKLIFANLNSVLDVLGREDDAHIVLSPILATQLLGLPPVRRAITKAAALIIVGGALSPALRDKLLAAVAHRVVEPYGATELGYISWKEEGDAGIICAETEIRIVDHEGNPISLGQMGWIEVRSPRCVAGYIEDPELTQKHFINGWFRTFDVGYMPEAGKLVVLGRGDDVLNIGGVKIAPQPIEDEIKALTGVTDAVLLALPSAAGIEGLHVVIERADPSLDAQLIDQAQRLIPEGRFQGHFVDKMPRTETGKVQRNVLRDVLLRHMQTAAPTRH